jgi:multidrug efflux pump subunit AcrA (membrane-fusion protein)
MGKKQQGNIGMFKNKRVRNWLIAAVAVAILIPLVLQVISPTGASTSAVSTEKRVVGLEVAETIEASGSLEAQLSATLTWNTDGVIGEVYLMAGDEIKVGDALMKLRTTTVSSSIISAQADLVTAQKELDDLLSSSDTELAQAVIDLKDSREEYDKAVTYLAYLERSKKVPQTQTKIFIESKQNSWQYVYKTKTFEGPVPED